MVRVLGSLVVLWALLAGGGGAAEAAGAACPAAETWRHAWQDVAVPPVAKTPRESEAAAIRAGGGAGPQARIVERYSYSAFGRVRIWQDGNGNSKLDDTQAGDELTHESQFGNSFMFTGRELDRETGLYHYRARYYSPQLGRFTQMDPIGFAGGSWNLFEYVGSNPLTRVDPWGLEWGGLSGDEIFTGSVNGSAYYDRFCLQSRKAVPCHVYTFEYDMDEWHLAPECRNINNVDPLILDLNRRAKARHFRARSARWVDAIRRHEPALAGNPAAAEQFRAFAENKLNSLYGGTAGSESFVFNTSVQQRPDGTWEPIPASVIDGLTAHFHNTMRARSLASSLRALDSNWRSYVPVLSSLWRAQVFLQHGEHEAAAAHFAVAAVDAAGGLAMAASVGRSVVLSQLGRLAVTVRAGARSRVPWQYGNTHGALGTTDKFGNITIMPGLQGKQLTETVRHEAVHRFFSPRPGPIGNIRADIGMAAYRRSHLVRFLEEGLAESVATGSLRQGFAFPITHGYVSGIRVLIESVGYVTVVGATAFGVNTLLENE